MSLSHRRFLRAVFTASIAVAAACKPVLASEEEAEGAFENFREGVRATTRELARRFDRLFADSEYEIERTDASLRLRFDADLDEDGGSFQIQPRLRLHLPAAQRWLMIELEGERSTDLDGAGFDLRDFVDETADDDPLELRLRLADRDGRTRITPEVGLGYSDDAPQGFVGLRLRHTWRPDGAWSYYVSERVRAHSDIGLESVTVLRADRKVWDDNLFRADLQLTWRADEDGFEYTPGLHHFAPLNASSGLAFDIYAKLETEPDHQVDRYVGQIRYRTLAFTDWTTVEVAPRVMFQEKDDFAPSLGALLRLDVEF